MSITYRKLPAISVLAGIEAFIRQPNPYTRTYALYDLAYVPPHESLQGEGTGWMIQAAPAAIVAAVLIVTIWLT